MARITSTDTDVTASLPQPTFAASNGIDDYATFIARQGFAVASALSPDSPFASKYGESELKEALTPFTLTIGTFPSLKTRYLRPVLFVKDNHNIPKLDAVGMGLTPTTVSDSQNISWAYTTQLEEDYLEVVEVNSDTQFSFIWRSVGNASLTIGYQAADNSAFVSAVDLAGESNGTQSALATTFISDASDSTSIGSRSGFTVDVTVTDGAVTALSVNSVGLNYASGDLLSATLAGGAVVTFRYVNASATYANFQTLFLTTINTAAAHGLKVGDVITLEHDNSAADLLGTSSPSLSYGGVQYVDADALYFFYQGISSANYNNPAYTQAASSVDIIGLTGATVPGTSDIINPTSMGLSTTANTVVQTLNPTYKAVKLTCSSAWSIKQKGGSTFTSVAANEVYILRYSGVADAGFYAKAGTGTPTLNWSYFVG